MLATGLITSRFGWSLLEFQWCCVLKNDASIKPLTASIGSQSLGQLVKPLLHSAFGFEPQPHGNGATSQALQTRSFDPFFHLTNKFTIKTFKNYPWVMFIPQKLPFRSSVFRAFRGHAWAVAFAVNFARPFAPRVGRLSVVLEAWRSRAKVVIVKRVSENGK